MDRNDGDLSGKTESRRISLGGFFRHTRSTSNPTNNNTDAIPLTPKPLDPESSKHQRSGSAVNSTTVGVLASAVGNIVIPLQYNTGGRNSAPISPAIATTPTTAPVRITLRANSPKPRDLWQEAANKLQASERKYIDSTYLANTPWKSVVDELICQTESLREISRQKAWKITWGGRTLILRDVAEKTVSWLQKFKEVGDVAVQYDPGHASLPWAGVRFLLQAIVSDFEGQAAILVGIEKVTSIVARFTIYEQVYLGFGLQHEDALRQRIVDLYFLILRFLVSSKNFFEAHTLARAGKAILKLSYMKELDEIEKAEEETIKDVQVAETQRNLIVNTSRVQNSENLRNLLKNLDRPVSRMDKGIERIIDNLNERERGEVLQWASSMNHYLQHEFVVDTITKGTCIWLHAEAKFREWRDSSSSAVFWLKGDPGCGKTRLTSSVIQLLLDERDKSKRQECIAYFYCDGKTGDESRTDPKSIIGSLLKQMACIRPGEPLQPTVANAYRKRIESGDRTSPPSFKEAKKMIFDISADQLYSRITIVIDAMDECNKEYRGELIDSLVDLVRTSNTLVKVFFSSRPHEDDLSRQLEGVLKHCIDLSDTSADVELFIDQKMLDHLRSKRFLPRLPEERRNKLKEDAVQELKGKCRGMFLWADLQMKELCRLRSGSEVVSCLARLPLTLKSTYQRIFDKIIKDSELAQRVAATAFRWILGTVRPLSPGELLGAIQEKTGAADLTLDSVLEICQNLIVMDHTEDVVRFMHLSVLEFLQHTNNMLPGLPEGFSFKPQECLNSVTLDCLEYLSNGGYRRFDPSLLSKFWVQYYYSIYNHRLGILSQWKQRVKLNPIKYSVLQQEVRPGLEFTNFLWEPRKHRAVPQEAQPDLEFTTFVWEQWALQLRQSTDRPDDIFDALKCLLGRYGDPSKAFQNLMEYGHRTAMQFHTSNEEEMCDRTKIFFPLNHEKQGHKSLDYGDIEHGDPDYEMSDYEELISVYDHEAFWKWAMSNRWNGFTLFHGGNLPPLILSCRIGLSRYIQWSYDSSELIRRHIAADGSRLPALCFLHMGDDYSTPKFIFCREIFETIINSPGFTITESETIQFLWHAQELLKNNETESWLLCILTVIRRHTQFSVDPFCIARFAVYAYCLRSGYHQTFPRIFSALEDLSEYPPTILTDDDMAISIDAKFLRHWLIHSLEDEKNGAHKCKKRGELEKYLPQAPLHIIYLSKLNFKDLLASLRYWLEIGMQPNRTGSWGSLCHFLVSVFLKMDDGMNEGIGESQYWNAALFEDLLQLIVSYGGDIDIKHPVVKETPLEYACRLNTSPSLQTQQWHIVKALLRFKAKMTRNAASNIILMDNKTLRNFIEIKTKYKVTEMATSLLTEFRDACKAGSEDTVLRLIEDGLNPHLSFPDLDSFKSLNILSPNLSDQIWRDYKPNREPTKRFRRGRWDLTFTSRFDLYWSIGEEMETRRKGFFQNVMREHKKILALLREPTEGASWTSSSEQPLPFSW